MKMYVDVQFADEDSEMYNRVLPVLKMAQNSVLSIESAIYLIFRMSDYIMLKRVTSPSPLCCFCTDFQNFGIPGGTK